jgi:hypothetical protein
MHMTVLVCIVVVASPLNVQSCNCRANWSYVDSHFLEPIDIYSSVHSQQHSNMSPHPMDNHFLEPIVIYSNAHS